MRSIVSFDPLADLRFADPSLMLDLAVLAQRLRAEGRALSLRGPQPQIRTLIELVGLDRLPSVAVEPLQGVSA